MRVISRCTSWTASIVLLFAAAAYSWQNPPAASPSQGRQDKETSVADIISMPRADGAEVIHVLGDVNKPGAVALSEQGTISVMQVMSLAGGPLKSAALKNAKILRPRPGAPTRTEIPVNVKKILSGRSKDVSLLRDDILYVPRSASKRKAVIEFAEIAAAAVAGYLSVSLMHRR